MCPTFSLLCDQYALHLLHWDPMFPPMGRGKNPNPRIQFWQIYFYLHCTFKKTGLVHPGRFHGDTETSERKTDPQYFRETFFIFNSCLKLSFLLLLIATQKPDENLVDVTF